MRHNSLFIGSIKDSNGVWHPYIASPVEEFVHQIIENKVADLPDEPDESGFWTKVYTVEKISYVVPTEVEDEEYISQVDDWNDDWMETSIEELESIYGITD